MGNTAIEELLPDINKAIQETRFRQIKLLSKKDMASYSGDCGFTYSVK
ncbi:MAG: hypothetical protein DDT32_01454 [Syntrophomonadaceae bacterium]|nr:hypothetical protein [Bacillota bacterium]